MNQHDLVVFVGRFQPLHVAHIDTINQAKELATTVLVLIGSTEQPRTIKNPFTYSERKQMILSVYDDSDSWLKIEPLPDAHYDDGKWEQLVTEKVNCLTTPKSNIGIIGYEKDRSSYYLNMFPQWEYIKVQLMDDIHSTTVRRLLFSAPDGVSRCEDHLHPTTYDFLEFFPLTSEFQGLCEEYTHISNFQRLWTAAPFAPVFVTVDVVVIHSDHVLLVQRKYCPGKGQWAMPGGFVEPDELLVNAAVRELVEETGIDVASPLLLEQAKLYQPSVYDHPTRSLRGRTITHVFYIELFTDQLPNITAADDASNVRWIPIPMFKRMEGVMFEDHYAIIASMLGEMT